MRAAILCPHPDCRQAFGTEKALKNHLAQKDACRKYLDHSREVFEARQVKAKIIAGTVRDMHAEVWKDDLDDGEYDPQAEMPVEEDELPRRSTKTTIEDVPDDEDDAGNGQGPEEDSDFEDERPVRASHAAIRELREMRGLEDVFDVTDDTVGLGQAGPGPSTLRHRLTQRIGTRPRFLDDDDTDENTGTFVDEHPTAGHYIRMDQSLRQRWSSLFGHVPDSNEDVAMDGSGSVDSNMYQPFASKLDWEIAQWMVKDGIGHSSFDRLLKIEGVSSFYKLHVSLLIRP